MPDPCSRAGCRRPRSRPPAGTPRWTVTTTARHHAIDYVEITVTDLARATGFYTAAFGWAFHDYGPGYAGIMAGLLAAQRPDGSLPMATSVDVDRELSTASSVAHTDLAFMPQPLREVTSRPVRTARRCKSWYFISVLSARSRVTYRPKRSRNATSGGAC